MTRLAATVLVFLSSVLLVGAAEVSPPSPIPEHHLIRVKLAEGERAWILRSDFEPVDLFWASAEKTILWTGTPGRYAILTWTETSQDQQIVEIVKGDNPGPDQHNPVALDDVATTDEATQVRILVVANDTDQDGDLDPTTVRLVSSPVHGQAVTDVDGSVLYLPQAGFSGTDVFKYTVSDKAANVSNAANVTVTVKKEDIPDPTVLNEHGIGHIAYAEALRVGKPTETRAMVDAARVGYNGLLGGWTPAMAEASLRTTREKQQGNWGVWEAEVEKAMKQAIATHGGGALMYRDFFAELVSGLDAAVKKQGGR